MDCVHMIRRQAATCVTAALLLLCVPAIPTLAQDEIGKDDIREVTGVSVKLFFRTKGAKENSFQEVSAGTQVEINGSRKDGDETWFLVTVRDSEPQIKGWIHSSKLSNPMAVAAGNQTEQTPVIRESRPLLFPADAEAVNQLGIRLLEKADDSDNPCVSPYGIWANARLWMHGARGETARFLTKAMGISDLGAETSESGPGLFSESRLIKRSTLELRPDYQSYLNDQECRTIDSSFDETERTATNTWINECSGLQLNEFFDPKSWPSDVDALFINVTSAQTEWLKLMPRNPNSSRKFQLAGKKQMTPVWMSTNDDFRFHQSDELALEAVVLPCKNEQLAGIVILPKLGTPVSGVLKTITTPVLVEILESSEAFVRIEMPEFQASSSADVMEDLGLKEGLTGKPNFSGISETPVEFSTVAQGTKMKVTEAGISAAAVTYATANVSAPDGLIKTDHELIADRPFLFVLVHVPTQTTLFITHVNAPSRPE